MKHYEFEDLIQKSQFNHTHRKTLAIQLSITTFFEILLPDVNKMNIVNM